MKKAYGQEHPKTPTRKNIKAHYAEFQKLNLNGKYEDAQTYAMEHLAISPTSIRSYEPLGDLFIGFNHGEKTENYKRSLDLETGIAKMNYQINGKRYLRESFISSKYNVVFYRFESLDEEVVESTIRFTRKKDIKQTIRDNQIQIEGQIFDDPNGYDDNEGGSGEGGYHMKFASTIAVKTDGKTTSKDNNLLVKGAKKITVILSAATDYNLDIMSYDRRINANEKTSLLLKKALKVSYEKARKEHIIEHAAVYNRVNLKISDIKKDSIPTNERLKKVASGIEDKYLSQVLFQYGRYLLMNSSGFKAKLPANLQGIWNKDMWAAWESDYHLNINLQMNYWAADLCNLSETYTPLSNFMVKLADKGKVTANKFIGSDGWTANHVTNVFGRTTPSGSNKASQVNNGYSFPIAGSWMALTIWRHYEFTADKTYLKETAYPLITGATRYILDFLQENNKGELVTAPSYSPENAYINPATGEAIRNTVMATMDIQIITDLFNAYLKSVQTLGITDGFSDEVKMALLKLPKVKIGANGTINEWYEDYKEQDPGHRHISHLYGLYPSNQITPKTPQLFEAAKKTIDRRLASGGGQTGWSRAWSVSFFARLGEGEECVKNINALLSNQTFNNMFDLYTPKLFQIDGNLGVTAGMAEMLVQSHGETIAVLPALPDSWGQW